MASGLYEPGGLSKSQSMGQFSSLRRAGESVFSGFGSSRAPTLSIQDTREIENGIRNIKHQANDAYFTQKLEKLEHSLINSERANRYQSQAPYPLSKAELMNPVPPAALPITSIPQQMAPYGGYSPGARYVGNVLRMHENFNRVDYSMNEALRFDEMWHNCDGELRKINDDLDRFVKQWPPCSFIDKFKGPFFLYPWQDPVMWNILLNIKDRERDLAQILGEIPHYTQMHQLRSEKLRKLTSFRIEIERTFEYLANEYRKPCFTTLVVGRPRTPPEPPKKPNLITFNIYWDFLLRFWKNCDQVRVAFSIYNRGDPKIATRSADAKKIIEHDVEEKRAIWLEYTELFYAHHIVKDLEVDPDSVLVFEVQGTPRLPGHYFRPEDFDIYSGRGTGYPLYRPPRDDDEDIHDADEKLGPMTTLAWCVMPLFNQRGELLVGNYKTPLYLPPSATWMDLSRFHLNVTRARLANMHMRIEANNGQQNPVSIQAEGVKTASSQSVHGGNYNRYEPTNADAYWVPDMHEFTAKMSGELRVRKEADYLYKCPGINVYIHHVEGIVPERHVRIGYLIQFGKYVVKNRDGHFCFFATKGVNPFNLAGFKKIKKDEKDKAIAEETIPVDDGCHWFKNFYRMVSHYWSIGLMRNLNLVLLYLQLKPGVKPSMGASITKALLEAEYDLLGYTKLKLHDDDAKIQWGRYKLPLYDGPPYVEDIRESDKNGGFLTFTVEKAGVDVGSIDLDVKHRIVDRIKDKLEQTAKEVNKDGTTKVAQLQKIGFATQLAKQDSTIREAAKQVAKPHIVTPSTEATQIPNSVFSYKPTKTVRPKRLGRQNSSKGGDEDFKVDTPTTPKTPKKTPSRSKTRLKTPTSRSKFGKEDGPNLTFKDKPTIKLGKKDTQTPTTPKTPKKKTPKTPRSGPRSVTFKQ